MAPWKWPTTSNRITTPVQSGHVALDIAAPLGSPVLSPTAGYVERLWPNEPSGYGNLAILKSTSGQRIFLAHLSRFGNVRAGQYIAPGQLVGFVGSTGRSSGPHLHFEVRDMANRPVNPQQFYGQASPGDIRLPAAAQPARPVSGSPLARPSISLAPASNPQQPTGSAIRINTPVGPVSVPLPKIAWANLGLLAAGAIIALMSLAAMLAQKNKAKLELAKEIAPSLAMVAGPEASAAVGALVAADKAKTGKEKAKVTAKFAARGAKSLQKARSRKAKSESEPDKAKQDEQESVAASPNIPDYEARRERLRRITQKRMKSQ